MKKPSRSQLRAIDLMDSGWNLISYPIRGGRLSYKLIPSSPHAADVLVSNRTASSMIQAGWITAELKLSDSGRLLLPLEDNVMCCGCLPI